MSIKEKQPWEIPLGNNEIAVLLLPERLINKGDYELIIGWLKLFKENILKPEDQWSYQI